MRARPGATVERELEDAIGPLGAGREHLAHPLGAHRHLGHARDLGHALDAPAGEVGDDRIEVRIDAEAQLRLEEDVPAPRATDAEIKRPPQEDTMPG